MEELFMERESQLKYRLNLQYFSDDENDDVTKTDELEDKTDDLENEEVKEDNEPVTFDSKADLEKLIESESDKKLDKALRKREEKWQSELDAKVQQALKEDKRISQLSETERVEKWRYELDDKVEHGIKEDIRITQLSENERVEEQLTQREKDLMERENKIKLMEIKSDAVAELNERQIDTRFSEWLLADNADDTFANIKRFNEVLDAVINSAVKESTRQEAPRLGGSNITSSNGSSHSFIERARKNRVIK